MKKLVAAVALVCFAGVLSAQTNTPTNTPTSTPTNTPTNTPSNTPTKTPTRTKTPTPTRTNTFTPTNTPTPIFNVVHRRQIQIPQLVTLRPNAGVIETLPVNPVDGYAIFYKNAGSSTVTLSAPNIQGGTTFSLTTGMGLIVTYSAPDREWQIVAQYAP